MSSNEEIINRVANSSLISFDLEELYQPGERIEIDVKNYLFQEIILREKDFRDFIKSNDWSQYKDKFVSITCSVDAVIPTWAYMLLTISLEPFAKKIFFGSLEQMEENLFYESLSAIDWNKFSGAKVVVKGCSKVNVPVSAYVETVKKLRPIASSIMFGEPCSTVPLYKKKLS